jgi:hypothetical protein
MQFYYRGDDLAPFRPFLGLELLYNRIFIITLHVLFQAMIKSYNFVGRSEISIK